MKVKALEMFYDLERGVSVPEGTVFDVSEERCKELTSRNNKMKRPLAVELDKLKPKSVKQNIK